MVLEEGEDEPGHVGANTREAERSYKALESMEPCDTIAGLSGNNE